MSDVYIDTLPEGLTLELAQAWRLELMRAKATGQELVSYDNKTVRFRSMAEIDAVLLWLEKLIAGLSGTTMVRSRQVRMITRMPL